MSKLTVVLYTCVLRQAILWFRSATHSCWISPATTNNLDLTVGKRSCAVLLEIKMYACAVLYKHILAQFAGDLHLHMMRHKQFSHLRKHLYQSLSMYAGWPLQHMIAYYKVVLDRGWLADFSPVSATFGCSTRTRYLRFCGGGIVWNPYHFPLFIR